MMKWFIAVVLVLACLFDQTIAQQGDECTCREADSSDSCSMTFKSGDGPNGPLCDSSVSQCTGCSCDEAGDLTCRLIDQKSFSFVNDGQPQCRELDTIHVQCPGDDNIETGGDQATPPPGTSRRETIETQCQVRGVVPALFNCVFSCFATSLGELVDVKVDYLTNFTGTLGVRNNGNSEATDISLNAFVTADLSYIIPSAPATVVFLNDELLEFIPQPGVNVAALAPGEEVSGGNFGELQGSFPSANLPEWYLCSSDNSGGSNPAAEAAILVDAEATAVSSGSVSATSEGIYSMALTITYTYDTTL